MKAASLYSCAQPLLFNFGGAKPALAAEGDAMKNFCLSVLLFVCLPAVPAAGSDSASEAPVTAEALCSTLLNADDFTAGGVALDLLLQKACSAAPDRCMEDDANQQAFFGLNAALLAESSKISRKALEAFFKEDAKKLQFEFYELGYIFDTLLLKRVSDAVCAKAATRLEKVQQLASWTFEHVSLSSSFQQRSTQADPVYPLDIIERGFGLDFQVSWAFAALVQQQGLASALVYVASGKGALSPVLVLVFLEEGSVLVDPVRGLVWQDPAAKKPVGIREALEYPEKVARLHPQYSLDMARAIGKASFRIPYHPLALLPKMKTVQSVLGDTCGSHPVLYVDLARAHSAFGHRFCRVEGVQSFRYNPELMTFRLPDREYSCGVWLLPLFQLFAMGFQDVPPYRESRRMHLRGEYDQADLNYRRSLAATNDPELRAEYTYFMGLVEYDRRNYEKAAFALQRYLDRYYKAREDHVRFLLARTYQLQGNQEKSADCIRQLKDNPLYEYFFKR
jgi:hypothetical protein